MQISIPNELLTLKESNFQVLTEWTRKEQDKLHKLSDKIEYNPSNIFIHWDDVKILLRCLHIMSDESKNIFYGMLYTGLKNLLKNYSSIDSDDLSSMFNAYILSYYISLRTLGNTIQVSKSKKTLNIYKMIENISIMLNQLSIPNIWNMETDREHLFSLIIKSSQLILEHPDQPINSDSNLRESILDILIHCYDKSTTSKLLIHTFVLQNLKLYEHLTNFTSQLLISSSSDHSLLEHILHDIGQEDYNTDDHTTFIKSICSLLVILSEKIPLSLLKHLSYIGHLLYSETYSFRCSLLDVISSILQSAPADSENFSQQSDSFLRIIEERFQDINSFVRCKVLSICISLCKSNKIPLSKRSHWIDLTIDRLNDKSSNVRKKAIQLLSSLLVTHPFALDGGELDITIFNDQQSLINNDTEESILRKRYYTDGIKFIEQLSSSIPIICSLLTAKSKLEIVESIEYLTNLFIYKVRSSDIGIKKMMHLIWQKDSSDDEKRSIRETLLTSFKKMFIDDESKLVQFVSELDPSELLSLEEILSYIRSELADMKESLWNKCFSFDQKRPLVILLCMLSGNDLHSRINIDTYDRIFDACHMDPIVAKYFMIMLQKPYKTKKGICSSHRLPSSDMIFVHLIALIIRCSSEEWLCVLEQIIKTIYSIAEHPDEVCSSILRRLASQLVSEWELSKLIFIGGHIAIQQCVLIESIESNNDGKDTQILTSDHAHYIKNEEMIYGSDSILCPIASMVTNICYHMELFPMESIQKSASLAMVKFMATSQRYCKDNLGLFLTLLEKSSFDSVRANLVIGFGDIIMMYPNLMDQNLNHLFARLHDSSKLVKRNALTVLTHVILNGIVKMRGQMADMTRCLLDSDNCIVNHAKLFFTELSEKDSSIIYNNIHDILGQLNSSTLGRDQYEHIVEFIFGFVKKDKQVEALLEKICIRFQTCIDQSGWIDLAFCLKLLPLQSESCIRKLIDCAPYYMDKIFEPRVFQCFCEILGKAKKFQKIETRQIVDEFETKLTSKHEQRDDIHDVQCKVKKGKIPINELNKLQIDEENIPTSNVIKQKLSNEDDILYSKQTINLRRSQRIANSAM